MPSPTSLTGLILSLVATCSLAGCSPASESSLANAGAVTRDAATRASPVVAGRPARVFVFTALGAKCEALTAPTVRVVTAPSLGEVSLREGQRTTVAASASGRCVDHPAVGTGIYYTARAGAMGLDRFTVEARAADGTTQSRTFEVKIEP